MPFASIDSQFDSSRSAGGAGRGRGEVRRRTEQRPEVGFPAPGSGNGGTLGSVAFANVQNLVGGNGNFRQNRNGQNLILALNGGSRNPAAYAARLAALRGTPHQNGCCTPAQTCNGVDALSVLAKSRRIVVRSIMPSQITSSRRPRPTACATLPSDWPSR